MSNASFVAQHINATSSDLKGNNGIGRYIFLPGSDGRAKQIANRFDNMTVKEHPRGHHFYMGTLTHEGHKIDVASIASGMGTPSMEIILHELFYLGGKRFLRVGTAGTLQPAYVKVGDIVNVQASVRDEQTTLDYAPPGVPAIASLQYIQSVLAAAQSLQIENRIHTGVVHCKSSLYARELGLGPRAMENKMYQDQLIQCGIIATEMETAALFIQSQIYDYQLRLYGNELCHRVLSGAILGVIADPLKHFDVINNNADTINCMIELALQTVKELFMIETVKNSVR